MIPAIIDLLDRLEAPVVKETRPAHYVTVEGQSRPLWPSTASSAQKAKRPLKQGPSKHSGLCLRSNRIDIEMILYG